MAYFWQHRGHIFATFTVLTYVLQSQYKMNIIIPLHFNGSTCVIEEIFLANFYMHWYAHAHNIIVHFGQIQTLNYEEFAR